ncbi:MAG: ABC transporter permease subunit [Chloroflexi bacterium]|nr:ABC transporter permease subunit [Chloroflexota bacterium]
MAAGTIVLVHDATIGERQLGVTEWLLSKPVSRPAYVLSKLFAHGFAVLVILVGLQTALGYGLLWLATGEALPLPAFLTGMAGLAVNALFYLALTLMLGVLTANRVALLGAALGLALIGFVAVPLGTTVGAAVMLTPFAMIHVLPAAVMGQPLPLSIWAPIGITAILSVVFVAVTLAKFERMEFWRGGVGPTSAATGWRQAARPVLGRGSLPPFAPGWAASTQQGEPSNGIGILGALNTRQFRILLPSP